MERVVLIRHDDEPEDDRITGWLARNGVRSQVVRPFLGEALPKANGAILGTAIYGGHFNVYEEHIFPFLNDENRWIEACMKAEIPVLGICQGAQSMARVLGAHCGPLDSGLCEWGVYELIPTESGAGFIPDGLNVLESHFHGFEIPSGAQNLAESRNFRNQILKATDQAYGFQFHAEVTRSGLRRWQDNDTWGLTGKPGAQTRAEQDRLFERHEPETGRWFDGFLDTLFADARNIAA